ncbi:MAG: hypothetical protein LUD68_08480 [Rikenellaceae bacterium]|nr:hypothetical protein [Rikenellaceae bacterium]
MKQFKRFSFFGVLLLAAALELSAQRDPEMAVEELRDWRYISQSQISANGKWAAAKVQPWEGDAALYLYSEERKNRRSLLRPAPSIFPLLRNTCWCS